jgi:hypothetical protein
MNTVEIIDKDEMNWQTAVKKDTIPGYHKYLRLNPIGKHVEEANTKLAFLNKNWEQAIDKEWDEAITANSYYKVLNFVKKYPNSKYSLEYEAKLKECEHFKAKEDEGLNQPFGTDGNGEFKGNMMEDNTSKSNNTKLTSTFAFIGAGTFFFLNIATDGAVPGGFIGGAIGGALGAFVGLLIENLLGEN